jgi:hypothetical protein
VTDPVAFVLEADLVLDEATREGAPGAAVTVELCGGWEHEGPCRFPHYSELHDERLRTLVVADPDEADAVAARFEDALRAASGWTVLRVRRRDPAPAELEHAEALRTGPRLPRGAVPPV